MSVAILTARHLGLFVAVQIKSKACQPEKLADACRIAELISQGNVAAFKDSYGEDIEQVTADDVEREALRYLADKTGLIAKESFGGITYNLVSQNGRMFFGSDEQLDKGKDIWQVVAIKQVETACDNWQTAEARRVEQQQQDDAAYAEVEPLPLESSADIVARCEAQGFSRVIIASFCVDESDGQSDYYGGRTARQVVIGFGKGKRESFKQLREAAAQFEPTKHLGPKRGLFRAYSVWDHDSGDTQACEASQYQDRHSHFYKGYRSRFSDSPEFETQAELDAWIAANPLGVGNSYEQSGDEKSIEHRENYSMGGGNYLGYDRYSGWKVSSLPVNYFGGSDSRKYEVLHSEPVVEPQAPEIVSPPAVEPTLEPDTSDIDATDWL